MSPEPDYTALQVLNGQFLFFPGEGPSSNFNLYFTGEWHDRHLCGMNAPLIDSINTKRACAGIVLRLQFTRSTLLTQTTRPSPAGRSSGLEPTSRLWKLSMLGIKCAIAVTAALDCGWHSTIR